MNCIVDQKNNSLEVLYSINTVKLLEFNVFDIAVIGLGFQNCRQIKFQHLRVKDSYHFVLLAVKSFASVSYNS